MFWLVLVACLLGETLILWALPIRLLVALPAEDVSKLSKGIFRTLGEDMNATLLAVPDDILQLVDTVCESLSKLNPHLLVSFLPSRRSFYMAMITGQASLPVLNLARQYTDRGSKEMNPLLVSLDPSPSDLSDALFHLLTSQEWTRLAVLVDGSQFAGEVARRLALLAGPDAVLTLTLPQNRSRQLVSLGSLQATDRRVLAVCCSPARHLMREARRLGMVGGEWVWILLEGSTGLPPNAETGNYPPGTLGLRLKRQVTNRHSVRSALELVSESVKYLDGNLFFVEMHDDRYNVTCWNNETVSTHLHVATRRISDALHTVVRRQLERESSVSREGLEPPSFEILGPGRRWRRLGNVTGPRVALDAWLRRGGGPPWSWWTRHGPRFRVVTAFAPPFVKEGTRLDNGSCLIGVPCLQVGTHLKEEIVNIFAEYRVRRSEGVLYNVTCCAGISISLLLSLSRDLGFSFDLYLVADGLFGSRGRGHRWNGIAADLVSGAAHMTLAAFSMTSDRQTDIDFSVPYFHSGVSCLTSSQYRVVPLSAFLVPFSIELWVAIFFGLTATAVAAAIYEWLSPFGLNPWGRQRTKNFSLASALWVMWSLLFSHLVAFKAPKSWPNKVLINVWGCFSVIFLASYTANIAALFAGLFFHLRVDDFHDASLLNQRTGTARASAAEFYVYKENPELWQHIQRYGVDTLQQGLEKLRNKELDVLIGDTAILNYFRGNDAGCNLHLLGDSIFDDAYAIGVNKGFPITEAISRLLLRYSEYGYVDQLSRKWYGRVPCFDDRLHRFNQPEPLSVGAVAGPFIMLLAGLGLGLSILVFEHVIFRYALPVLRKKPKECLWRSPNLMFFSQKLYRFINTVDLVSPHHSIKEIVANLREGQIASLFQKSVKKKFKEEARRRRSKSQFFDMIQEMRKIVRQQNETKPPSWEDSRQQLTTAAASPPQWPKEDEQQIVVTSTVDAEEDEDEEDESTVRLRNYLSSLRDSTKVSVLLKTCQYQTDEEPESLVGSSSYSSSESSHTAEFSKARLRMSASTGDLPSECSSIGDRLRDDYLATSRSADDVRDQDVADMERAMSSRPSLGDSRNSATWRMSSSLGLDRLRLLSLDKEEIVRLWQSSERALLNRLQDTLREKRLLEQKLLFVQKTLLKPP